MPKTLFFIGPRGPPQGPPRGPPRRVLGSILQLTLGVAAVPTLRSSEDVRSSEEARSSEEVRSYASLGRAPGRALLALLRGVLFIVNMLILTNIFKLLFAILI